MKKEKRLEYRNKRNNIKFRFIKNLIIFFKVINNKCIKSCSKLLIYVSYDSEVDTIRIIKYFLKRKTIYVPKVICNEIIFFSISSLNDLKKGYHNILEPISNDELNYFDNACVIVPGICFDKLGYRIGYGKGFYDRFLGKYKLYSIGLTYRECIIDKILTDEHDVPVDEVISD